MRVAGIMSGTSLDGIDIAVVDIRETGLAVIAHKTTPYPEKIREALLAVSDAHTHTSEVSRLNFLLAELYAKALRRCGVPLKTIKLIGSHGQTIYHERHHTLQIGDGSVLAERTGIPVVSDFRPRDMAAGGRGAPLVPFVDYMLYRHPKLGRVALNLGGIGNLTAIPPAARADEVIAFDTGPGNMVVDALVSIYTRGKQRFDSGGRIAAQGKLDERLLDTLLRKPYYRQAPPKTAGREQYGSEFVSAMRATGLPAQDLIATATALTAAAVSVGIRRFVRHRVDELIVSGGGSHNRQMLGYLKAFLPEVAIRSSKEFGIDPDAKEAIAFAVLAHETWNKRPSNLPSATG
ncbi:MAG: anhydro-N-acetylmuramic acid kinase, partial [Bryobacteraceae bacterium]